MRLHQCPVRPEAMGKQRENRHRLVMTDGKIVEESQRLLVPIIFLDSMIESHEKGVAFSDVYPLPK